MKNIFLKKTAVPLLAAVFFVSLDRFLKIFALSFLNGASYALPGGLLKFDLAKNEGIAFSLPLPPNIAFMIILLIIIILLYNFLILVKKNQYSLIPSLTIIIFGAISNLYDRLKYGFVIDYIDLKYYSVFNLADCLIVIGTIIIAFKLIYRPQGEADEKKTKQDHQI